MTNVASPSVPDAIYTQPGRFIDSDHPEILAYARAHGHGEDPRERAVSLYYAIRDEFRYTPWNVYTEHDKYRASVVLARAREHGGHCVDKATLLAACARALAIPARLHFANVRNHVGTARLEAALGTDLLVYHGYCEMWLDGRWVAATPAFNKQLCERLGVAPLEFDGREDSVFQAYDRQAGKFMEYVTDHGTDVDVPVDAMIAAWRAHYKPFALGDRWPTPA
jgi:transglutaminase-like putative cysteine protease